MVAAIFGYLRLQKNIEISRKLYGKDMTAVLSSRMREISTVGVRV